MDQQPENGQLRVWWIPQVPGKPFHAPVKTVDEAKLLLRTLAEYDLFQLKNRIKPDYANAGGLEVFDKDFADDPVHPCDGWVEWYSEDGDSIDDVMKEEA